MLYTKIKDYGIWSDIFREEGHDHKQMIYLYYPLY